MTKIKEQVKKSKIGETVSKIIPKKDTEQQKKEPKPTMAERAQKLQDTIVSGVGKVFNSSKSESTPAGTTSESASPKKEPKPTMAERAQKFQDKIVSGVGKVFNSSKSESTPAGTTSESVSPKKQETTTVAPKQNETPETPKPSIRDRLSGLSSGIKKGLSSVGKAIEQSSIYQAVKTEVDRTKTLLESQITPAQPKTNQRTEGVPVRNTASAKAAVAKNPPTTPAKGPGLVKQLVGKFITPEMGTQQSRPIPAPVSMNPAKSKDAARKKEAAAVRKENFAKSVQSLKEGAGKVLSAIGKGAVAVGKTTGKVATTVGNSAGKAVSAIGKGAVAVGKTAGKVATTVGKSAEKVVSAITAEKKPEKSFTEIAFNYLEVYRAHCDKPESTRTGEENAKHKRTNDLMLGIIEKKTGGVSKHDPVKDKKLMDKLSRSVTERDLDAWTQEPDEDTMMRMLTIAASGTYQRVGGKGNREIITEKLNGRQQKALIEAAYEVTKRKYEAEKEVAKKAAEEKAAEDKREADAKAAAKAERREAFIGGVKKTFGIKEPEPEKSLTELISEYAEGYKTHYSKGMSTRTKEENETLKKKNADMMQKLEEFKSKPKQESESEQGNESHKMTFTEKSMMDSISRVKPGFELGDRYIEALITDEDAVMKLFTIAASDSFEFKGERRKLTEKQRCALAGALVRVAEKKSAMETAQARTNAGAGLTSGKDSKGVQLGGE